jgi:hypothetical protein
MPITNNSQIITLTAGGGTQNLPTISPATLYIVQGTTTLTSNWTIQSSGTAVVGMQYNIKYEATIALDGNTITVFGTTMPSTLVDKSCEITAYYDGTDWEVNFILDLNENGAIPITVIEGASVEDKTEFINILVSFETGEVGNYFTVHLPFRDGFALKAVYMSCIKEIEATDTANVSFFPTTDLINPFTYSGGGSLNLVGDTTITYGERLFTNAMHPLEYAGPDKILCLASKTTPGGKALVTIEIVRN